MREQCIKLKLTYKTKLVNRVNPQEDGSAHVIVDTTSWPRSVYCRSIVFLLVVQLFEIYRFIMKIFTHIPHNRWGLQCLPLQQNNFFFTHWLFIAQQCNILLASCSHNSLSKMVVVLSLYCCCHVAFVLTSKPIFSAQINAYASLL